MTGREPLQLHLWEEDLQTSLDYVNSTLGTIEATGGELQPYKNARDDLENLLKEVLKICDDKITSEYSINTWVFNYSRYISEDSCDYKPVEKKDEHISWLYEVSRKTTTIKELSKSSHKWSGDVAIGISDLSSGALSLVLRIKKINCCMKKIEKGISKSFQEIREMSLKRDINRIIRRNETPIVYQLNTSKNQNIEAISQAMKNKLGSYSITPERDYGNQLIVGSSSGAGLASTSANFSPDLGIIDKINDTLSSTLSAAGAGSLKANLFANISATIGCTTYNFGLGTNLNLGFYFNMNLGLNLGLDICVPKFGISANVGGSYSANAYAITKSNLKGYLKGLLTEKPKLQYVPNQGIGSPYSAYTSLGDELLNSDFGYGLISPDARLDTHEELKERAVFQANLIQQKIKDMKKKRYCCSTPSKKKPNNKYNNIVNDIVNESLITSVDIPSLDDSLDNIILTDKCSFYNPISIEDSIITINNVEAYNVPSDRIIPIINSKVQCAGFIPSCSSDTTEEDIDLNSINIIDIKKVNTDKNEKAKCNTMLSSKSICLPIPNIVEVNNELKNNIIKEDNSFVNVTDNFILSSEDLEDDVKQQYFFKSVDLNTPTSIEKYQVINGNIVKIIE